MKKLILIASLLMGSSLLWAEEDNQAVCKISTKNFEEQLSKCKEGDILDIRMGRVTNVGPVDVALRACKLNSILSYPIFCIYRGSLREVR